MADAHNAFRTRLAEVPPYARKLLAHAAELAYGKSREERAPDVAYLPELHESCGLDVESMYALLHQLESARLIDLEGAYPFQDVKLRHAELRDYVRIAAERNLSLHEALGDLKLDQLS